MNRHRRNVPELEADLKELESRIATLRTEQAVLVNELDKAQAPQTDGSRSLVEWIQAHLDVTGGTARDLVFSARTLAHHRYVNRRVADGACSFDRAVASLRLAATGVASEAVINSYTLDLHGVGRLVSSNRRISSRDERTAFDSRYFASQPSLDHSHYRFWGQLPGIQGRTVEKAMFERADELRERSPGVPSTRSQRQADALTAMAQDSLDRSDTNSNGSDTGHVTVFVDARRGDAVETDAEIEYGPRVGPNTLDELVCTGRVRIVGLENGRPVTASRSSRAIPRATRDAVTLRDGGCTIRWLSIPLPPPDPPHPLVVGRRRSRLREPDDLVLVPPPCGHPRKRIRDRSRLASDPPKAHPNTDPSRCRPSLRPSSWIRRSGSIWDDPLIDPRGTPCPSSTTQLPI